MNMRGIDDVYGVNELEATGRAVIEAHERGHDLGEWRSINEQTRVAGCRHCGRQVWIVCPPDDEKTWRVGGNAFDAGCERGVGKG